MKIAILGYYGHANAGDEAFQWVFKNTFEGHEVSFYDPNRLPAFNGQFDALVLGGGNVIGNYFLDRLVQKNWHTCPRKWALGVGLSDKAGQVVFDTLGFTQIQLRNASELPKLQHLPNVSWVPDLVFSLYDDPLIKALTPLAASARPGELKDKTIAIVVSLEYLPPMPLGAESGSYDNFDRSLKTLARAVEKLRSSANIRLVAMSSDLYHYDEVIARLLFRACPNAWRNVSVVNTEGDPVKTLQALKGVDCVLSMKFHGLVFGMLLGVPVVNISRNIKNADLMASAGMQDLSIDLSQPDLDAQVLMDKVALAESRRDRITQQVRSWGDEAKRNLAKCAGQRGQDLPAI